MKSVLACLFFTLLCGKYVASEAIFSYTNGEFTILENLDLKMEIPFTTISNKTEKANIKLTQNAKVLQEESSADAAVAVLSFTFGELFVNNITQKFKVIDNEFEMTSIEIQLTFDDENFPNAQDDGIVLNFSNTTLFGTTLGKSYMCNSDVVLTEDSGIEASPAHTLTFSNMQLQPFKVENKKFSEAVHCSDDRNVSTPAVSTNTPAEGTTTAVPTDLTTFEGTTMTGPTHLTTATPPPPTPDPVNNHFSFSNGEYVCILENLNAAFVVTNGKTKLNVPLENATVSGSRSMCGNLTTNQSAVLSVDFGNNTFTQVFSLDGDNFYLQRMKLHIFEDNQVFDFNLKDKNTFRTPVGKSLQCDTKQTIHHENTSISLDVTFSDVKLQPYGIEKGKFSSSYDCPADNAISNIVPIAVGCALAVLVIIVLIAYLIGRRNSSRSGYESV